MKVLVEAGVLTVGLGGRAGVLRDLPVRIVDAESAAEAVRSLRSDSFEGLVTRWHLPDAAGGEFVRRVRAVKPTMVMIVLVNYQDHNEEILARSVGVSAVLTESCSDQLLLETVAEALGLQIPVRAEAIVEIGEHNKRRSDYKDVPT